MRTKFLDSGSSLISVLPLLASARKCLRDPRAAAIPGVDATIALIGTALEELNRDDPDRRVVKSALILAAVDLRTLPAAEDLCFALEAAAFNVFHVICA